MWKEAEIGAIWGKEGKQLEGARRTGKSLIQVRFNYYTQHQKRSRQVIAICVQKF